MENLLIINKNSFGSPTSSYKWCENLKDIYNIKFLCFGKRQDDKDINGIRLLHVNNKGFYLVRGIRFLLCSIFNILFFRGKIVVIYFAHCDILKKIFPKKKMLLDIRTLSINSNPIQREIDDKLIRKAALLYDEVIVISEGMKKKLDIDKIHVVPLGSDCISNKQKDFTDIKLLYVGTLNGRKIEKTLEGLKQFKLKNPNTSITYDIIGDGLNNELEMLKSLSHDYNLDEIVTFHGRIPHSKLSKYFDKCNIGVSFVPMTSYYDVQPPTKTYEYIISGLYTIATNTKENSKIINKENGILIKDTSESFCSALEKIFLIKSSINEHNIRESLKEYTWVHIIKNRFVPILNLI